MADKKISAMDAKATPVDADSIPIYDSEAVSAAAQNKRATVAAIASAVAASLELPETYYANPMTAAGDLVKGGASGAPARLAVGTEGQVLTVSSGVPAWEDAAGGGSSLPVDDTTALVRDPVTTSKQIRIDAGNVPISTTVVLQSPGVSAVAGLIVLERSMASLSIGGSASGFVASRAGRIVGFAAYFEYNTAGTYPLAVSVQVNGDAASDTMTIPTDAAYGNRKWARMAMAAVFAAGDVVRWTLDGDGSNETDGSGTGGTPGSGTVVAQFEIVYDPAT